MLVPETAGELVDDKVELVNCLDSGCNVNTHGTGVKCDHMKWKYLIDNREQYGLL